MTTTRPPGPVVQTAWLDATSAATGIPRRALQGYATATLRETATTPGCGLTWNTLAAIGDIESAHGTHGGARIDAAGNETRRILGPALDGTHGTVALRASGHSAWVRAVGPLQILPSTWAEYGADGNGDGRKDANNIDDAALAAADYLCAAGGDLGSADGWTRAVLAYNHDDAYLTSIRQQADAYARDVETSAAG